MIFYVIYTLSYTIIFYLKIAVKHEEKAMCGKFHLSTYLLSLSNIKKNKSGMVLQ